jgi:predicted TIM-barrel fold metal-dependent hydrolase
MTVRAAGERALRELVLPRRGLVREPLLHFSLGPADRPKVQRGQLVTPGSPLFERIPDAAVAELEWALSRDARVIVMRAAPVATPGRGCSPADRRFDPFWARANEAGITVAYHSGDSGYFKFFEAWGVGGDFKSFDFDPLRLCMSAQPISDTLAALLCGGVLDRHPNLRIATIETGSSWVPGLLSKLKKAYGQMPFAFKTDPVEAFRRHVWVSPYYEDRLPELRDEIGADHMLFGSDFPHGEGLAKPTEFVKDLAGFSQPDIRLVMRENGMGLVQPRPI